MIKKKFNRRFRLSVAFLFAFFIIVAFLFVLPIISPRYLFTIGDKFTVLTPRGFDLGQLYDFNTLSSNNQSASTQDLSQDKELLLPRPDNHIIVFKYPQVISLGRPTYLGNDISQSVDFTVKTPPATGLIQIWVLESTLDDFLDASKNYSTLEYLSFETRKEKKDTLNYILWDYTFVSEDKTIRGLEAFFDDPPYMYRISIFVDNKEYDQNIQDLFNEMVKSVTVK